MKNGKLFLLIVLCTILLCGCGKSDHEIAKEAVAKDGIFTSCRLTLDEYEVIKRQTNNNDKTDYVWLSVKGSNDNLVYSANYTIEYVKYNDGWHLENIICDSSSYTPKNEPTQFDKAELLSNHYDSLTLSNTDDRSWNKQYTQCYEGTIVDNRSTAKYLVTVEYEFSAIDGWKIVNISEDFQNISFNLVGEWLFQDNLHSYYIHVSSIHQTDVTMEYAFLNKKLQPDDELWSLRKIESSTYKYCLYSDDLLYTIESPMVYLDVGWKKTYSSPRIDEKGLIWFSNKVNCFYVNGYQLEQVNDIDSTEHYPEELRSAEESIVDYSLIPADLMDDRLVDNLNCFRMTYAELGLNPNKSSGLQRQRYPFGKVAFMGKEYTLFLYCVPEDNRFPYMLGITAYSHNFSDIMQYFLNSSCATLYKVDDEKFIAVLNGTDIMLEVSYQSWNPTAAPEIQIKLIS